jgi:CheY-like chemotaxis protein
MNVQAEPTFVEGRSPFTQWNSPGSSQYARRDEEPVSGRSNFPSDGFPPMARGTGNGGMISEGAPEPKLRPVISIVDDNDAIREALEDLTRSLGFMPRAFASAEDYLASDAVAATACLISDVQMPRVDGVELQERLIASGMEVPIIFVTGLPDESICARVMKAGAVDYLLKPVNESDLVASIHLALARNNWAKLWDLR